MDTELLARIKNRQLKLKKASKALKAHFIGLDDVIDKIIANIEAWFCTPEVLTRPTIVCLWGLTGTGKTDLVRRLTNLLDMSDNFVEIQLTNQGSSQSVFSSTLQSLLESSNITPEDSGILLLDEIQRFRSIDEKGEEIHDYKFQDLWMLLSDGSFGSESDNKQGILDMLLEAAYYDDYNQARFSVNKNDKSVFEQSEIDKKRKFKDTYYGARRLKKKLKLSETLEEIMCWDSKKKLDIARKKLADKSVFMPEIYSRLLVFISGNLDEAYTMASQTEEVDVDADILHKHSLKLNLLNVKSALKNRFKPEQIARFGNSHVIYPALRRISYEQIIDKTLNQVVQNVHALSQVKLTIDKSVKEAIYRNGVFPAQGTRPVFSTISSFFESLLPNFTLKAMQADCKEVNLYYENKYLCGKIGSEVVRMRNEGDIDKIRINNIDENQIANTSVHEAGHALIYALLFGYMPTQISIASASNEAAGFIGIHSRSPNREILLHLISVFLAGRVAEEMVFGIDMVSSGAESDIKSATEIAGMLLRKFGMGSNLSRVFAGTQHGCETYYTNLDRDNPTIETMLQTQKVIAQKLIEDNKELLIELSDYLILNSTIESNEFIAMFEKHGHTVKYLDSKNTLIGAFDRKYKAFKKNLS